ncbi:hypothetical protein [Asanoa iriomotensis]|uniref:Uncharacterized protein n=1 Tax=Asanoa iriomotensis TaxID=234613 RepID=A0ABQ4CB74_9ACTN|nr:hypothetical protein [Asanoa iriomotensis]GIF60019.1 hypothetical protein Air01nite_61140 [Asanoa iriomotensis]
MQLSLDPTAADPDVAAVRQALAARDWPAASKVIAGLDGHTRTTMIDMVGDNADWTARLTTARGLEMGQAEARRRYDRLAALDPHHLPGQRQLLQQLCAKWGWSLEDMHAFATEATSRLSDGAHAPWSMFSGDPEARFREFRARAAGPRRFLPW